MQKFEVYTQHNHRTVTSHHVGLDVTDKVENTVVTQKTIVVADSRKQAIDEAITAHRCKYNLAPQVAVLTNGVREVVAPVVVANPGSVLARILGE